VDPREVVFYNLPDGLETPSLKDVSEYTFHDVPRGEAAAERRDAAPARVAMAPSWSPIPAKHVAGGGVVRDTPLIPTSLGSDFSSPSLDDESELSNHTSISPFSQPTASSEPRPEPPPDRRSLSIPAHPIPPAGISNVILVPLPLSNGQFSCPHCPRKFSGFARASYHLQKYRHTHHCPVAGCRWSYQLHKDLLRHSATHVTLEERERCPCPVPGCNDTVSRPDLIKRHIERNHPKSLGHEVWLF
jgi:hypothetical protein